MTDAELIVKILSSKKPTDVFPDTDWKKVYLQYSKLIHPDSCSNPKANDAMAILNKYKDQFENGILHMDDSGEFKYFGKKIEFKVTDLNRKLLKKSYDNFVILSSKKDKASLNFRKYLPAKMTLTKETLTIDLVDRTIPLNDITLEQNHVNWIFSRMFEFTVWLRQLGISHLGINPESIFVVPETHGIICISFYHMTTIGKKATTVSSKYKIWYPTLLFSEKIATPDIDLELAKKLAIYLLGDKSGAGTKLKMNKDVNKVMLTFLLTKHPNEFPIYEQYRKMLKENFERKFYMLNL